MTGTGLAAIGPPCAKIQSSTPIGSIDATMVPKTMPMGRSRSVSSSSPALPALRVALATRAERIPPMMGPRILSRVQIAATPMVPAPMKRALVRKVSPTMVARSAPAGTGAVRKGTMPNQLITSPTNMATPTDRPTRWPTPISAIEKLVDIDVAPVPKRKKVAASSAISRVLAMMVKEAAATALSRMADRPRLFSSAPARDPAPTLSTSAAATPSG